MSHEHCLLSWIKSFECLTKPPLDLVDLADGIALHEILHAIDSQYFDISALKRGVCCSCCVPHHLCEFERADTGSNWLLSLVNVKKLVNQLKTYYDEVLFQTAETDTYEMCCSSLFCMCKRSRLQDRCGGGLPREGT